MYCMQRMPSVLLCFSQKSRTLPDPMRCFPAKKEMEAPCSILRCWRMAPSALPHWYSPFISSPLLQTSSSLDWLYSLIIMGHKTLPELLKNSQKLKSSSLASSLMFLGSLAFWRILISSCCWALAEKRLRTTSEEASTSLTGMPSMWLTLSRRVTSSLQSLSIILTNQIYISLSKIRGAPAIHHLSQIILFPCLLGLPAFSCPCMGI